MIRSAARRVFLLLLLLACAVTGVAAIGVLAGAAPQRALSLGLYAVGSFVAVIGFALGTRRSLRGPDSPTSGVTGGVSDLWETTEAAALLIVLGLALLAAGVAIDSRVRLV